ncbi:MAG: hypothetical protein PWQ10_539, partial [Patescibacteria group bacterium]|nr:hypothetical protein [Patescibacteria group bacterium]
MRKRTNKNKNNHQAFTIVELLVVIVVIGILATITIVSYTGITSRANETAIKSELSNASTKLNLYYATYSSYPTTTGLSSSTNWCPTLPTEDNEYCLKFSAGTGLVYEAVDLSNPSTYTLTATKNNLTYRVTNNLAPYAVITIPITSISSITGTPQVSQTLTAGTITPSDATVSYQWQSSTTSDGTYENIVGATSSTYTLTS